MKSVALNVVPRTLARRGGLKKLRTAGRVPAVIYGRNIKPQPLEIDVIALEELLHHSKSEIILVDLNVQGDERSKRLALVQEIQHHVLSGDILHVDLHEVAENEKVTIMVPVEATGTAQGVKANGGVLEFVLFKLKVRALPKNLPENLILDVSHLDIGQAIHLGDIQPPEGVEILGDKKLSVIAVAAPQAEIVEETVATETLAEPEVIREKKEEGEEGEGAAPAGDKDKAAKPADKAAKPADKAAKPAEKKAEKK